MLLNLPSAVSQRPWSCEIQEKLLVQCISRNWHCTDIRKSNPLYCCSGCTDNKMSTWIWYVLRLVSFRIHPLHYIGLDTTYKIVVLPSCLINCNTLLKQIYVMKPQNIMLVVRIQYIYIYTYMCVCNGICVMFMRKFQRIGHNSSNKTQ